MRIENYPKSIKEYSNEYPPFLIANTIWEYIIMSFEKTRHLINELKNSKRTYCAYNNATTYEMINVPDDPEYGTHINIRLIGHLNNKVSSWISIGVKRHGDNQILIFHSSEHENIVKAISPLISNIIAIELFIQFAEIETKILSPNRQLYNGVTCLYNNKTDFPIEIIDSTWFTNLISSGAFKVRGHFRLQPFGQSMAKRKLIWISDFVKNGYTREAKILQNL